ncbi:hypothetical protein [Shewanella psychrotolerans]|uniref:hypothetical protein n=1 Tax=Shewanella psychrotolerans TaxID=2864206 RepID=UPI001C6588C8|nr:hypothetical protein [Shewanella psychrotolerans]QYJ99812.1 hypothetical protein K0I62_10045 [Shewanella psychrotolerans]
MGISSESLKVEPSGNLSPAVSECANTSATRHEHNPCGLYASIHAGKGRSRVHTWYLTFSDLAAFGVRC